MAYNPRDYYYQQAKKENFAARSVFKLEEIDQRFRIVKPGTSAEKEAPRPVPSTLAA